MECINNVLEWKNELFERERKRKSKNIFEREKEYWKKFIILLYS